MKIVILMGGLGNVLFQLNYAELLAEANVDVAISTSILKSSSIVQRFALLSNHRTLESLEALGILNNLNSAEVGVYDLIKAKVSKVISRAVGGVRYVNHGNEAVAFKEENRKEVGYFHLNVPISAAFTRKLCTSLSGLAQRNGFEARNKKELAILQQSKVLVHYRGGDFSHQDRVEANSEPFYKNALCGTSEVCVVTADRNGAQIALSEVPSIQKLHFIGGKDVLYDMWLMGRAERLICSNSTLCWWAAEVGDNEVVVEPRVFYRHLPEWTPRTNIRTRITI